MFRVRLHRKTREKIHMDNRDTPATVLVADDDDAVRQFVRTAIEQIGLNVFEASNGRGAGAIYPPAS